MEFIVKDENGNPKFIGQEDPTNPPVKPLEGSKMTCPVCNQDFDYLLGQDTPDGGRMGCEQDWRPGKGGVSAGQYDKDQEII